MFRSYGGNLHECSHKEAFLKLVQKRFTENGLYILDELEAALSAQRQLSLLYLIVELDKKIKSVYYINSLAHFNKL